MIHNGISQEEIEKASNIPFRNVIEDHIGRILNANLKFNEPNGPIRVWYEKLYKTRNEIVHSALRFQLKLRSLTTSLKKKAGSFTKYIQTLNQDLDPTEMVFKN